MSIIKSITDSLPSEHMVAVAPAPETLLNTDDANPDASSGPNSGPDSTFGRRRLNLFTGRALSHQNLTLEQTHRDRHLNLLGQQLSAGVINGLMADLSNNPAIDTLSNPLAAQIVLTSGTALTIHGEDLNLPSDQALTLGNLPVYARPANLSGADTTLGNGDSPLEPRRLGDSLRSLVTAGATLPTAGVVVLQPVTTESSGAVPSTDPCAIDIDGLAFANLQRLDGIRIIFYAWPTEWLALPPLSALSTSPDIGPTPAEINRWRSQLAYSIFRRELAEPMPWNQLGVPIALIGFDANWNALFSDRHAVVRQGGRALHRAIPVPRSGNPFLWQARLEQFAEQLSELDLSQIPPEQLDDYFAWLPPVGFLPANVVENLALPADGTPVTRRQHFFPTGYRVEVAPIPAEQLDLVFKESAPLLPYDTVSNDASSQVKLLVPVPEDLYEPDLLKLETIDPIFNTTLTRFINRRAEVLHRRQLVRSSATHLNQAISGRPILFPTPEADQLEASEKSQPDAPFSSPRAHQSALAQGVHEHGFTGATTTLSLQENSLLTTYVYLDAENPPTELMLTFQVGADSEHRAYWGGFTSQINRGIAGTASRQRIGELPDSGAWTRLEVPIAAVGLTPNTPLTGMTFTLFNGRAAWGHTARLDTRPDGTGSEQLWVSTNLPAGATALNSNEPWLWLNAAERLTPFEERYGIEGLADGDGAEGSFISAIAQLKTDLLATSPIDRDVVRISFSGTDAENQQLTTLINRIPASIPVSVSASTRTLSIQGVLSTANRDQLLSLVGTDIPTAVAAAYRQAVTDLFEQSQDNTALDTIEEKGLEDFILFLERLANEADDQIEFGFLRVRTDMFRIRQLVLDNEDASRLSVSPTLAAIAKQDTATATQKDLSDFFKRIKSEPAVAQPTATAAATPSSTTAASLPLINTISRTSSAATFSRIEQPAVFNVLLAPTTSASAPIQTVSASSAPFTASIASFSPSTFATSAFLPLRSTEATISAANADLLRAQTQKSTPFITAQSAAVITEQSPLIGKVNQSITIAERLNAPPEPEARNYTLAGRVSVVNSLAGSVLFKDLSVPGDSSVTFGQIKRRPDSIVTDPGDLPQAPDKAAYFSSSVRVLDNTVAALRVAEGRIATYRKAISRSRSTLQVVEDLRQQAQARLNVLSGEVANARHDVSVTRALLAEEQQRLTGINQRREAILKTAVKALVFHRPRSLGPNPDAPVRPLNPGVTFPERPNLPQSVSPASRRPHRSRRTAAAIAPQLVHSLTAAAQCALTNPSRSLAY